MITQLKCQRTGQLECVQTDDDRLIKWYDLKTFVVV